MKIFYITRFVGDYHAPRLIQLQTDLSCTGGSLIVVQLNERSEFYSHIQVRRNSLINQLDFILLSHYKPFRIFKVFNLIRRESPDVITVLGYADVWSILIRFIGWHFGARVIFMSDSKADDGPRGYWKERLKSILAGLFDGALVAGDRHREYLRSLGFSGPIGIGFDVVDNEFFERCAERYRRKLPLIRHLGILPYRYVLSTSRLVQRKRVDRVIEAYVRSELAGMGVKLVIAGDGPLRASLLELIRRSGVEADVVICGSVPNVRMPLLYAGAEAFLLLSEYDQWGLSVNEALAAGVPAIVSSRCGVAGEIVLHETTGFVVDGEDVDQVARFLRTLVTDERAAEVMKNETKTIMRKWGLDRYSSELQRVARTALLKQKMGGST